MHVIDGKQVSTATWLASEREFNTTGHTSYIRPAREDWRRGPQ